MKVGADTVAVGLVRDRHEVPAIATQPLPNRDVVGAMYGTRGLLIADAMFPSTERGYFYYTVDLQNGKTVTLQNKTSVPVKSCVKVWLQRNPEALREDYYSEPFNAIEPSDLCATPRVGKEAN